MAKVISLSGSDWLFKEFVGEDWIWRNSQKPDTRDTRWWNKGTVPGTVLHDLWTGGDVPDPYRDLNSKLVEWVPERTWVYRKTFIVDKKERGRRIRLHFKGVDYEAQFFLNGKSIGRHKGMYTPALFEISDVLLYGEENLLAVVIEKAPDEQPQVSKTEYVKTHKSRMTYWWDFCPRMIHQGIWDDVFLEITGPVRLEDVYVRPQWKAGQEEAPICVTCALTGGAGTEVEVETRITFNGETVASEKSRRRLEEGNTEIVQNVTVPNPGLWWPNGYGEQPLYEAEISVTPVSLSAGSDAAAGVPSDERKISFGIRSVERVSNETEDATALPYTFVVNGRRIYIKGWNWVPIDVMYGVERPDKLERLLTLAKRANVNMLRVWGGGLIEKDAFYNLCSRYGIMVWQEFIQSSSGIANKPSTDPEFLAMMAEEAEQIIPRKRNHASLVLWCGGNELQGPGDVPLDDREPVLGVLSEVVKRLDPDRHWLPTSPTGRLFSNTLDNIAKDPAGLHDVHGPWEHQGLTGQYTLYNSGTSLLHSEFGVEGMTNRKTLDRSISAKNQWPPSKDNPVYFHRGAWWINESVVQEAFGGIDELGIMIRASQMLQAEGLRYAIESNRRRKYQNSGTLPWQFNEPYPNGYCTSALDYYARPKSAYYAAAEAYRPVHVTASFPTQAWGGRTAFEAELWAVNSLPQPLADAVLEAALIGSGGERYLEKSYKVTVDADRPTRLAGLTADLNERVDEIFFLDLVLRDREGEVISDNRYLFSRTKDLAPLGRIPETAIHAVCEQADDRLWNIKLINTGTHAAVQLRLDDAREIGAPGYVYFSRNDLTLLPGECRTVEAEWSGVPAEERCIDLTCWNSRETRILSSRQ